MWRRFLLLAVASLLLVAIASVWIGIDARNTHKQLVWVSKHRSWSGTPIDLLGGEASCARKLGRYIWLPRSIAPDKDGAILLLGKCGDPGFVRVERLAKSKDADNRAAALIVLGHLSRNRPEAVDSICGALQDDSAKVRECAVNALGLTKDPRSVPLLVALLQDSSPNMRFLATRALGQLQDRKATSSVIAMLQDTSEEVRWSAVWALGAIGDPQAVEPLAKQLEGHGLDVRLKAAQALCKINDRRALDLCLGILNSDAHEEVRGMVASFLWLNGMPESTAILVKLTRDPSQSVRKAALQALGALRAPETAGAVRLVAMDRQEKTDLRKAAIDTLVAIGDKDSVKTIGDVFLDKEESDGVRVHAGLALGYMGGEQAKEQLKLALGAAEADIRSLAIDSLAFLGTDDVVAIVEACLYDKDPHVRERAAKALLRMKRSAAGSSQGRSGPVPNGDSRSEKR